MEKIDQTIDYLGVRWNRNEAYENSLSIIEV